jgi:hypothetical protein
MNTKWFALAGTALLVALGTSNAEAQAQDGGRRGNFDPAQFQQRMMERQKEALEVTDEQEWKAIQPLVQKVFDARMQAMSGRGFGGFGGPPRRGGEGDQGQQQRRFGPPPAPEAEALQKAVDAKASKAELKAAIAKYAEARKAKQAELEQAQENLRKVLTARQEALATLNGLL